MLLPDYQIIVEYRAGNSCQNLAQRYGCTAMSIHKLLVKHNEPRRKKWDHKTLNVPTTELNSYQEQVIEGGLLGDGSVFRNVISSHCSFTTTHQEFANHLISVLPFSFRTDTREECTRVIKGREYHCKKSFEIISKCDKSLNCFRDKWYKAEIKILPKDLILTPISVKYWFYGDGSTSFMKNAPNNIQLSFSTHNFTKDECNLLANKLYDACGATLGVYNSRGKPILKTTKKESVRCLFNYMKQCDLACFRYKWKLD